MENGTKTKKTKKLNLIIIIVCCVIAFLLFFTMLVDFILVSLSVSPLFSKIVSTSYNNGEYIEGHGLLYTTIETKTEVGNGHFAGYKFFLGYKKWTKDLIIPQKFYGDDGTVIDWAPPSDNNSPETPQQSENDDYVIIDGNVLNMDAVRKLADSEISPFDFMEKFPGTIIEGDPVIYYVVLPNDYVVRIAYSGNNVSYIHLEDHRINQYIDLKTQQIDIFLHERDE